MKGDMSRFVPKNQSARRSECRNWAVATEQTVIGRAGDFRQEKHLQFKPNSEHTSAGAKCSEAPMRRNLFATQAFDRTAKEARMFALFGKPVIDESAHL